VNEPFPATLRVAEAIDLYIGELARRACKPSTRDIYREILDLLADQHPRTHVAELTADDCRRFLDRWRDPAPATLANRVTCLRGFFRFLEREGHLRTNPMRNIDRPRVPKAEDLEVVSVSSDEVAQMLGACEDWHELLCLAVVAYTGPRRAAVARLRWQDVDLR